MHELGITQNIVAIALDHAKANNVQRITLEIGKLSAVCPDAIQFCFDVCCAGTVLEGSELKIIEVPGRGCCRHCGAEITLDQPFGICDCGSSDLEIIQGEELKIKTLEVEELCV
jgi:hydrogenase nickel incorporation protein HypA/HybF